FVVVFDAEFEPFGEHSDPPQSVWECMVGEVSAGIVVLRECVAGLKLHDTFADGRGSDSLARAISLKRLIHALRAATEARAIAPLHQGFAFLARARTIALFVFVVFLGFAITAAGSAADEA